MKKVPPINLWNITMITNNITAIPCECGFHNKDHPHTVCIDGEWSDCKWYEERECKLKTKKRKHSFKYFENKACEFFPCHPELWEQERVHNCLFCYCPLYYKEDCGGDPVTTPSGLRDCSFCVKNHNEESYDFILMNFFTDGAKFK